MDSAKNDSDTCRRTGCGGLELAYIGDAVYELSVRRHVMSKGARRTAALHREVVARVCAPAQAAAAQRLLPLLEEKERDAFARGRNAHPRTLPRGATPAEYCMATGLEALFGYLYFSGQHARIEELFSVCMEGEPDGKQGEKNGKAL